MRRETGNVIKTEDQKTGKRESGKTREGDWIDLRFSSETRKPYK